MEAPANQSNSHDWITKLGVKVYRLKSVFKRLWWVVLLTVSIGLLYEAWVLFSLQTQFQSVGRLMVSDRLNTPETSQYSEESSNFYGTQLQMLQYPEIQQRAAKRLAIEAPQLSGKVEIEASIAPRTSIFSIVGLGTNAQYTQRFVDALMDEFINYKRERRRDLTDTAMGQISEELLRLRKDLEQREKELHTFVEENSMAFWEEQGKTGAHFLSELKNKQATLVTELHRLENLTADELLTRPSSTAPVSRTQGGDDAGSATQDSGGIGELNGQYLGKAQELIQKQAQLEEMSKIMRPKHPKLIAAKEEVESIQRLLQTIRTQTKEGSAARIGAIKAELDSLDSSITTWEEKVLAASRKDAEYQRLQGGVTRTQSLYEKLLLSIQSLDVGKSMNQESLQILQHATPPHEVPPKTIQRLATGFIIGLLAGLALLFVLDRADDRISSPSEMIQHFSEPILGQIPNFRPKRRDPHQPLLQPDDPRYTFAESFRSLRSSLVFMPNESELRTLLVTSAIPNEGKSTVASNLAITMALAGAKVLLVDADLRRGDIATLFGVDDTVGLSNVLRDEVPWSSAVQATKYPSLSLIPCGPVTPQSSELLMVPLLDTLLSDLKHNFDLTIFNTSPILATDDTATLAPNFDGTLMVLRAQFTSARFVRNSLNSLYARQVNVLGLILNAVDTEMPDYYYYRYPNYHAA